MRFTLYAVITMLALIGCGGNQHLASEPATKQLHGSWQLTYISGPRITFDGLYPDDKPTISFDLTAKKITGNTSCNSFTGTFSSSGNKLLIKDPVAITKMACPGEGESLFLKTLEKTETYDLTEGYTLSFFTAGVATMRFTKLK